MSISLASLVSTAGRIPVVGNVLRNTAHWYREGSITRIRTGEARGLLWKRKHAYVNGYWVGTYELELQRAVSRNLRPGNTFFDVGANAGFFSLLGSSKVGPTGKCIAFEPLPENAQNIREQLALNHFGWSAVTEAAVGDTVGHAQFIAQRPGSPTACFAAAGQIGISVATTTLDEAVEQFGPPQLIKIDIEGAEIRALQGAGKLLQSCHPRWIIEVHGPEQEEGVRMTLKAHGYAVTDLNADAAQFPGRYPRHVFAS